MPVPVRYQNSPLSLGRRDAPNSIDLGGAASRNFLPISPPETDRVAPSVVADPRRHHPQTSISFPNGLHITPPTATGEPPSRYRRSPSIPYMQSGLQSRTHPAPSRPSRWLVVVMPPSSLNSEPALGHTLSTGPPGRFQSGILMPLFPTLYGQLAAISKEFSLPSTTGVCIYLHFSDPDLNLAPRISDEAWQLLWSHYFIPDEGTPSYPSHQLPICGQIEFDIDIRKARWYESWISGHARHSSLEATIPPAIAQSLSKWYSDVAKDRDEEPETQDDASVRGKHIPRPLALGRREGSARSMHKYKAINAFDGYAESTPSRTIPHRLPPVVQANQPTTAKQHDLNTLVRNWRASTPAAPALPQEEGTAKDTLESPDFELDLDDFKWSISSAGPAWYPDNDESAYARSVNLETRLEGSVALTPSVATSFGPDDDVPTPIFSNVSRYPSPDIAARFRESAPISPVTATSWGASLSWPTTPASIERVLSPDLAARAVFSRPETPMTATSWGAPEHLPASPFESFRPHTPDIGFREQHSRPATPSTATSWGAPECWPPSPIERTRPQTPDCAHRVHDEEHPALFNHARPWAHVWPFSEIRKEQQRALLESKHGSFRFVWPFIGKDPRPAVDSLSRGAHDDDYPVSFNHTSLWAHVWPFTEILKEQQRALLESRHGSFRFVWPFMYQYPQLTLSSPPRGVHDEDYPASSWPHVWPFSEIRKEQQRALLESEHGSFRFVWPFMGKDLQPTTDSTSRGAHNEDYSASFNYAKAWPHVWPLSEIRKEQERTPLESRYGSFRFVWPFMGHGTQRLVIDSTSRGSLNVAGSAMTMVVELETSNKHDPLAFVWPFFQTARSHPSPQSVIVPTTYPFLQIYRPVYPHVSEVYASKSGDGLEVPKCQSVRLHHARTYDYPKLVIYPSKDGEGDDEEHWRARTIDVKVKVTYPDFDLYPAVYPFVCLYPVHGDLNSLKIQSVLLGDEAPKYPAFDIYNTGVVTRLAPVSRSVRLQAAYPALALYEDVYPSLTIYPPVVETVTLKVQPVLMPESVYNYPVIGIYGPTSTQVIAERKGATQTGSYGYLNLYPAAYPHIEPYPPCDVVELKAKEVLLPTSEYHYPVIGIYGPAQMAAPEPCSASLPSHYGRLYLYPPCYPNFEVYPGVDSVEIKKQSVLLSSQECEYPNLLIYPGCRPGIPIRPQELPVVLPSSYGRLSLYPATYPPEPYPPMDPVELKMQSVLKTDYEYPAIIIYPGRACAGSTKGPVVLPTRLPAVYPFFDLYAAVYPFVEPYSNAHFEKTVPTNPEFIYPDIVIYAPVCELNRATHIDIKLPRTQVIYGRTKAVTLEEPKLRSVRVTVDRRVAYPRIEPYTPLADRPTPQSVRLSVEYPTFDLYPALDSIYPSIEPAAQCMKLSPLQHDGFVYPKIIIYQLLAVNPLEPCKATSEGVLSQGQGVSVKKPRKTHVQLYNEVFQSVTGYNPQQVDPNAVSILSQRAKQRKTHQELWQEVCPNGPEPDVQPALASPVTELPTFYQAPRLGRSRSASIARTQPITGILRTPSLRSSQLLPPNPAPPASLPGRMRAMSRATVRPTLDVEPSTRTKQVSLSFLSRSVEEDQSDKENSPVSMRPSQVRRQIDPTHPRSGSIVQRTAHMLTHPDEKQGPEPASTGAKLTRTPSKLDRSKFPFV